MCHVGGYFHNIHHLRLCLDKHGAQLNHSEQTEHKMYIPGSVIYWFWACHASIATAGISFETGLTYHVCLLLLNEVKN